MNQSDIARTLAGLDAWLDTMRGPDGYGGPVGHWWQDCLLYTGAGLDWRYEGIIIGYLNLFGRTGDLPWLTKARRAADDLLRGQLATANYRNSSFELNPQSGGTPHEAACDLALLRLAAVLRDQDDGLWEQYSSAAEHNLREYHLGILWNEHTVGFGNSPDNPAFTPNKSATICEVIFAVAALHGNSQIVERYAVPTLDTILSHQVSDPTHPLDGAIDQNSSGGKRAARFFPYYNARCIPALLKGYQYTQDERYLRAARRSMSFALRFRLPDGSFPQVVYGNGHTNSSPRWVAGVGDILRAMDLLAETGMEVCEDATLEWMLKGQTPSGGIRTACGFAAQVSQREPSGLPEFRDVLPACGWVDKAFRYLTGRLEAGSQLENAAVQTTEQACTFRGRTAIYREDSTSIELWQGMQPIYLWTKGAAWAQTLAPGEGVARQ